MYFQQIYRFEVGLLNKLFMSLPPEQSRPKKISSNTDDFGWGACWKKPPRPPSRATMNALRERDFKVFFPLPCRILSISTAFAKIKPWDYFATTWTTTSFIALWWNGNLISYSFPWIESHTHIEWNCSLNVHIFNS